MTMLTEMLASKNVEPITLEDGDMKDYKKFLNSYYRTFLTVTPIYIFSCKKSAVLENLI